MKTGYRENAENMADADMAILERTELIFALYLFALLRYMLNKSFKCLLICEMDS